MSNIQNIHSSITDSVISIPDGWKLYKWKDLILKYEQGLIRSNRELTSEGSLYFKMNNITEDGFCDYSKTEYTIVTEEEQSDYELNNGDFLINVRNSFELVGKTCVVSGLSSPAVYNHMLINITHVDHRLNTYINGLFSKTIWRKYIESSRKGTTTVIALYKDDLENIPIPIPPEPIFNCIIAFEDTIRNIIVQNRLICAELEAMAKTLYDYWFVQFDFPDGNGKPYRTSGGAMEWCPALGKEVPKGWKAGTVADLGEIVSGATPSTANEGYYTSDGIAWITPNDLSSNEYNMFIFHGERDITEAGLNSCSSVLMPAGSVLMSSRAPIGYLAIAANPVCTNQGFKSIICNKDFGTLFVYYTLKNNVQGIARQGVGTTFKEVSRDTLARYSILLPKTDIAVQFEQTITPIAQARKKCERENRELTALRDWLLPMLMNGQAKVGKEDEQ